MSPDQVARLKELDFPVVVPGYLPEGFRLTHLWVEHDAELGSFYRLHYQGAERAEIFVEGTRGGVGDVFRGEDRVEAESSLFGPTLVEHYEDPEEPTEFRSHWMRGDDEFPVYGLSGNDVDPLEVTRIVEGLCYLEDSSTSG